MDNSQQAVPTALTIAGSDPGAGAGIQADLKTFAALGVYGLTAITAVTVQNTEGVRSAFDLPISVIGEQIDAVLEDIGAKVAKTGMLSRPETIETVAHHVRRWQLRLVVDPVMRAKGGAALLHPEAVSALRTHLLPLSEVITPNIPEAEVLVGHEIHTLEQTRAAARLIHAQGPRYVIIKGGHRTEDALDLLFDGQDFLELPGERIHTKHTHGTGCTFSAAIAAFLAQDISVPEAVKKAKQYVTGAILHAPGLGHGHGPTQHFWQFSFPQSSEE